jgi:nitrite reductase/ring-hydroxylating ferredoxin subunit
MINKLTIISLVIFGCMGCGKATDVVPSVPVTFQANLTDPRFAALKSVDGAVIVPGYGVAGLILFHEPDGSYAAYDACSAYLPQNKCVVTLDNPSITVTDPCSGSKFSLIDGTPVKAPATHSLRPYAVNVTSFEIFVSN